jgi:hypothetical protein
MDSVIGGVGPLGTASRTLPIPSALLLRLSRPQNNVCELRLRTTGEIVMNSELSQNQNPEEINNTSSPEQADQAELTPEALNEVQGGVTFNPFSISRKIDKSSPTL